MSSIGENEPTTGRVAILGRIYRFWQKSVAPDRLSGRQNQSIPNLPALGLTLSQFKRISLRHPLLVELA